MLLAVWAGIIVIALTRCQIVFALNLTTSNHLQSALRIVESVQSQSKCSKVVYLDVLLDHKRWKREALLVLEVANLMTALWPVHEKQNESILENDDFYYRKVRSIIMFSPQSFGSVICFDRNQYKNYYLFCPYAYKPPEKNDTIEVFDIASQDGGYDYTKDLNAIWWSDTKHKAKALKLARQTEYYSVRISSGLLDKKRAFKVPVVKYTDGVWTRPYYDCFGGKIWMVTYMAPFFNESNQFLGAVSIDIQLKAIDINQCERTENYESTDRTDSPDAKLVEFLGTHRCKPTTKCVHVPHQGFKRGSYFCKCKKGYYFPKHQAKTKHFIGESAEAAYDAMLDGRSNEYQEGFDCLQCSPGCSECVDGTPCTFRSNYSIRISLACINGVVMMMAVVFGFAVCMYYKHKVIKASSPRFLIISVIGVVISYMAPFVMMSGTNRIQCIIDQWLQHMGFFIAYSAIIIKTWRVAVIFRVRSAQRIALTDAVLMRRLVLIVMGYVIYMFLWNNVSPSTVTSAKTGDGLIFKRCTLTVWSEILAILGDFGLLAWGMYVCYQVRNAPSAYNESKYVCWSIYNAMFVCCFATVLRFTIGDNTNPDIMFLLEFTFIHTTVTVMLILVVTHKFIHIRKNAVTANVAGSVSNASAHNNQANDRVYVTMDDKPVVAVEHEQLRGEIERLMNKVAVLQSQLMEERNKHVKNGKTAVSVVRRPSALMRLGFSFGVCSIAEKTAMDEEKDETLTQQLETS